MLDLEFRKKKLKRFRDWNYWVDEDGRIFNHQGVQLTPTCNGRYVTLRHEGLTVKAKVAYIVARVWLPNSELRPYVVHKNGRVYDNRVENLEWSESVGDGERKGRR